MKYIKTFEAFNPHPESDLNPPAKTTPASDVQKKVKTKEEVQKEEEEAIEAIAAGSITTNCFRQLNLS